MGIGLAIGRVRDVVAGNSAAVAVAGVAASVTLVGGAIAIGLNGSDRTPVEPSAIGSGLPGVTATDDSTDLTLSGRSGTSSPGAVEVTPGDTVLRGRPGHRRAHGPGRGPHRVIHHLADGVADARHAGPRPDR